MSNKKENITIILQKDGAIGIHFDGFDGQACLDEARRIEASLSKKGVKTMLVDRAMHETSDVPRIPMVTADKGRTRVTNVIATGKKR